MDKIAVLLPCWNEEVTIGKVVSDWKRCMPEATVYVYNNNSTDRTAEIAEAAGAIVRNEYQQGKGNVIRRMFREIDAECYIMADGDDTNPAENGPDLAEAVLERGADMAVGDRLSTTYYTENKRAFHGAGNTFVKQAINRLFKTDIHDIFTGYRAFSYEFVKTFPVLSKGFEIETEMSIHAADKNMRIENIETDYRDRPEGSESKLNTISDGMKVILTIVRLFRTYKPLAFFGILSLILAALGLGFMIPVLIAYAHTGMVGKYPTLIVCGFTVIAALMSLFTGLILESGMTKNRQDFEMQLIHARDEKERKRNMR
ncbi:MAG: glycosyltransferase [Eubacterium sp.]|nr:glycosyltransferase [Eubacterium sp.]